MYDRKYLNYLITCLHKEEDSLVKKYCVISIAMIYNNIIYLEFIKCLIVILGYFLPQNQQSFHTSVSQVRKKQQISKFKGSVTPRIILTQNKDTFGDYKAIPVIGLGKILSKKRKNF